MEVDNIIIGSGAGGLAAAICLARAGQSVLVLEQHEVPGGWCHSFYLDGQRFSPGVHYIGRLGEGQSTRTLYEGLHIANDLVFFTMNPAAYEHCRIGGQLIDIPGDADAFEKVLAARFPAEKKGIASYFRAVQNVSGQLALIPQMQGFWDHVSIPWRTRHLGKYGLFSLKRVMDWHIKDPLLKKVLSVQCGDHGLPPGKASFPFHCAVTDHYSGGAFYPMGGGGAIVKAMTNALKKNGGIVRTGAAVKQILLEQNVKKRAAGVELVTGEQIFAKRVISNADPGKTYLDLVGVQNLSRRLLKQLQKTKYSCSSLMLFITVDMDVRLAGLDSGNIWVMPDRDPDEVFNEVLEEGYLDSVDTFSGLFISCTTLKDPTSFDGRYHNLEVVTFVGHESFNRFKAGSGRGSKEYLDFKEDLMEKMLRSVERVLPGIRTKIVQKELGTPMTNMHYINATNGCVYGTEKSFWQIGALGFKAESEILDLYLCGASILSNGVAGATYSGVQTAAKILGCSQGDLLKKDGSQNLRVYSAEDHSEYPEWMKKKIEVRKKSFKSGVK
ncbi:MAG: NAD(P)/FAD-dependent oxidoreductase [Dyadobacter sp.]|uniref:phytoene desaturase family protein n=1 Tax=Dyadobacter sp. TaxID=1914288 RepID=UPI00326543EF